MIDRFMLQIPIILLTEVSVNVFLLYNPEILSDSSELINVLSEHLLVLADKRKQSDT
jgi:hypothetical protein